MNKEEIKEYVKKCPYYGSPNGIDEISFCKLEHHYNDICPSKDCLCAEHLGLSESTKC